MNYLTEIIYTALVCGILLRIAPGKSSKNRKYIKIVAALAFLTVLASPLLSLSDSETGIFENIIKMGESVETTTADNSSNTEAVAKIICDTAASKAAEEFSVPKESFSIKISILESASDEYSIEKVYVYRRGDAKKIRAVRVKDFFEKIFENAKEVTVFD